MFLLLPKVINTPISLVVEQEKEGRERGEGEGRKKKKGGGGVGREWGVRSGVEDDENEKEDNLFESTSCPTCCPSPPPPLPPGDGPFALTSRHSIIVLVSIELCGSHALFFIIDKGLLRAREMFARSRFSSRAKSEVGFNQYPPFC
jgi:hypothetical protein